MLMILATLLCLSSEPANDIDYIHEVDGYVEVNTFVSPDSLVKNTTVLKQVLIKRWIPQLEGHHIVHWMLIDKDYEPLVTKLPNGKYRVSIRNKNTQRFVVDCNAVHSTITTYDQEILDRPKFPSENRKFHFKLKEQKYIQRLKPIILIGVPGFN